MGPMQMKLLNEIEKSMRLKENGMNIASVVTLQEACVEAARDVKDRYILELDQKEIVGKLMIVDMRKGAKNE